MTTSNTVPSHTEASPARADLSRRSILRGAPSVAALAVAAAVPAVAFAAGDPDAELRRLWGEYLQIAKRVADLKAPCNAAYAARNAELPDVWDYEMPSEERRAIFDAAHAKHNCTAFWKPWNAAVDEGNVLIEQIRNTPSEGFFGIGIKLAAIKLGNGAKEDYEDAIAAALADIMPAIGVDLLAQAEEAAGIVDEDEDDDAGGAANV